MEYLVTIATFTYPAELAVIKGRLESEGIECYVKDEYTVQVHNFLSNAIGGIKLQVKTSDAEKAFIVLKETGYVIEQDITPYKLWLRIDNFTGKIPLIKKVRTDLRFIILSAIILIVLSVLAVFILAPGTKN